MMITKNATTRER